MTTAQAKERVGWLLFFGGLVVMLLEYALHIWGHLHGAEYRIGLAPIGIGAVFTFIGWFWLNRKDALEGGKFILDGVTGVLGVLRSGRRATDPAVVVKAPTVTESPIDLDIPPHAGGDEPAPEMPHTHVPQTESAIPALDAVAKAAHADPMTPVGQHVPGEGD